MFKCFDWSNYKKLPMAASSGYLKDIADKVRRKEESLTAAKSFAADFSNEYHVLRQFFDMKPKIGKFGVCKKDDENTVLTLHPDFIKGLKVSFYVSHEGIMGFEFAETGNE
jgi:hypothetical protein